MLAFNGPMVGQGVLTRSHLLLFTKCSLQAWRAQHPFNQVCTNHAALPCTAPVDMHAQIDCVWAFSTAHAAPHVSYSKLSALECRSRSIASAFLWPLMRTKVSRPLTFLPGTQQVYKSRVRVDRAPDATHFEDETLGSDSEGFESEWLDDTDGEGEGEASEMMAVLSDSGDDMSGIETLPNSPPPAPPIPSDLSRPLGHDLSRLSQPQQPVRKKRLTIMPRTSPKKKSRGK